MVDAELLVPYGKEALLGDVYESARVVAEDYDENGTRLTIIDYPPGNRGQSFARNAAGCSRRSQRIRSYVPRESSVSPSWLSRTAST